jgi:hypothetical protein
MMEDDRVMGKVGDTKKAENKNPVSDVSKLTKQESKG